jgi:ubiquinone/menaquinone biosynthesis C-methylase UbiE
MDQIKKNTHEWYQSYYRDKGTDRNDPMNPQVIFQTLSREAAIAVALRKAQLDRSTAKVLDVGCGTGNSLLKLQQFGFPPDNMSGIDIQEERIVDARRALPSANLVAGNATTLPWGGNEFDLVMAVGLFIQITDETLAAAITSEMQRVTRRYIVIIDWRHGNPFDARYRAVSRSRLKALFPQMEIVCSEPASLVPPVGRFLSKHLSSAYFLIQAICPVLVGLKVTLLGKPT